MPIRPELRFFYPIDWPQISHWVRFVRAYGHCEACGRPLAGSSASSATAAGGTSGSRSGGTARVARSPRLICLGHGRAGQNDQSRAGRGSSRPRPVASRSAAWQSQGVLPTLPSSARPARASPADPAHAAAAACAGGSVHRALSGPMSRCIALMCGTRGFRPGAGRRSNPRPDGSVAGVRPALLCARPCPTAWPRSGPRPDRRRWRRPDERQAGRRARPARPRAL